MPLCFVFEKMIVLAVPVFMLISFMLTQKKIVLGDMKYLKKRLIRLFYPAAIWAIIYYIIYSVAGKILKVEITLRITDLMWQMFTGHCPRLNPAMWYITILIFLSVLFGIFFKIFHERLGIVLICIIMGISFILQYTGINWIMFSEMRYELSFPLGRIAEMLPYAVTGFLISYVDLFKIIEKNRFRAVVFAILIFLMGIFLNYYLPEVKGFGYAGIPIIFKASAVLISAMVLPLGKLSNAIKGILEKMTQYTFGIFCMHNLVGKFLNEVLNRLGSLSGSFQACILIYAICYIASCIISRSSCVWLKRLVE